MTLTKTEFFHAGQDYGQMIVGTCQGEEMYLEMVAEKYGVDDVDTLKNNLDFCLGMDDITFMCEVCGWWCEVGEYASGEAHERFGVEQMCSDHEDEDP